MFNAKFSEVEQLLANKLFKTKQKVLKLLKNVEVLKKDCLTKSETNLNMVKLMENLKLESTDKNSLINSLRIENNTLTAEKINLEKCITDLSNNIKDKAMHNNELQRKNVSQ